MIMFFVKNQKQKPILVILMKMGEISIIKRVKSISQNEEIMRKMHL